jgi:hypothetical protein
MTNEELDEARAKEAWRIYMFHHNERPKGANAHRVAAEIAARLAREGWTPPDPVDPDVLAYREWFTADRCTLSPSVRISLDRGDYDKIEVAKAYLAGARMAREQKQERAMVLVEKVVGFGLFCAAWGAMLVWVLFL